ncbi:23S rRNA (adenine(2030)-N(6))-methyltransferase RlmJ, partial [Erwinia amylovora]|uniref:23S rRNA (adenine(2030)-N(6))-methyltransferase RlmJ n=1 Tax=Erwinia amylovora TaxID=552 RepID=UPI00200AB061
STGVFGLCYPVVIRQQSKRMGNELAATGSRRLLPIELAVRPDRDQRGLSASGRSVIHPPWKLEQLMKNVLPWLHTPLVPAGTGPT